MNEQQMRQIVVRTLRNIDAVSVENIVRAGTPDVNTTCGWIELKILADWPVRTNTQVKVPCFTPQQRVWLRRRWTMGGGSFFLIRIADDWLLFDGYTAASLIGKMTKEQMIQRALLHQRPSLDGKKLIQCLSSYRLGRKVLSRQST